MFCKRSNHTPHDINDICYVSVLSIKFLMRYIKTNDFKAFGWYRIVLGIIVLIYLFMVGDPTAND